MAAPRRRSTRILTAGFGLLLVLAGAFSAFSYSLNGYRWPDGAQIVMHLQLTRATNGLQDGSASWNASAGDALNVWNQYVDAVQFVAADPTSSSGNDGANEVLFSSTVYGGSWPTGVLAVTLKMSSQGSLFTETDVLFNDNLKWDSYRGPVQGGGPTGTYDLHRVALHEFGHVLGLDHPDQHGQTVVAQMNSIISDLDQLADDDVAGARALYGGKITSSLTPPSGTAGTLFSYQVTANNHPTSFTATGLPPGLLIDHATGLINGVPTGGGTFDVLVTAQGLHGNASATVRIYIIGSMIISSLNPPGVEVGNDFSYQIMVSSTPTSFEATGLPPGLELNANTGLISGVPTISGTYSVTIVAHGSLGDATARLTLVIPANPLPAPYDAPSLTLPVGNGPIATDLARSRIYVAHQNSIAVVDTASPHVITTIPISDHYNATTLTLSADGKVLWFVRTDDKIGRIDLETLTALPDLPTENVIGLREGLDHRLYCPSWSAGVLQIDATTGATTARFDLDPPAPGYPNACSVEISPDRKTLFVGLSPAFPGIHKYDVSTSTPTLLEAYRQNGDLGCLGVSHDGTRLCFWTGLFGTNEFDTSNITQPLGMLVYQQQASDYPVFSQDDSLIFQLGYVRSNGTTQIAVFNAMTRQFVRAITLPPKTFGYRYLGVDPSNSYVLVTGQGQNGDLPRLLFYPIHIQTVPVPPPPHSLLNVSTRLRAQPGDDALIGGLIINGKEPKKIALRAIGPSLPVAGKLADPVLQVFDGSGVLVAQNDNWNSHRNDVIATGIPPSDEHEAVIATSLAPGTYTAVVRGVNNTSGVALVEAYDLSSASNSKLANISTRGKVETGDNVMIGGFILGGDQTTTVVVRGLGPSLANYNIAGTLADPRLEVYDGNGTLIAQDDAWRQFQEQALIQSGLAPTDDREAAMILVLQPGAYTAIVRGENNTTGVGLVEVYNLETN